MGYRLVQSYLIQVQLYYVFVFDQDSKIANESDNDQLSKSLLYSFCLKSGEHDVVKWRAVLQNSFLYVEVPHGEIAPGGKEWYVILTTVCITSCFCGSLNLL